MGDVPQDALIVTRPPWASPNEWLAFKAKVSSDLDFWFRWRSISPASEAPISEL